MACLIWCVLLFLCADLTRGIPQDDVDRLANSHSDLVKQTFDVIDEAIEAQHQALEARIDTLEARVQELERVVAEGVPAKQPDDLQPQPKPEPEPEPEPTPEPQPEPEPTTTTKAPTEPPTTTKATTTATTTEPPPPPAVTPETCQDIFETGVTANDRYMIDPKGMGRPFQVMCRFDGGEGETMIHHDDEEEIANKGNRQAGSFEFIPNYNNADTEQLAALVDVSGSCEQFIKLRCRGGAILFSKKNTDYGWWVSRDGEKMRSWGGVSASMLSRACACSNTRDCAGKGLCNCDAGTKAEKVDEGLLTDKEHLPVKAVYLGDTPGRKASFLTLGALVCKGRA